MRIPFRQGVVQAEQPQFIQVSLPYASLYVQDTPLIATMSAGTKDYLVIEKVSVQNAWGPLAPGQTVWLYLDLDIRTGVRTFGKTNIAPIVSSTAPTHPSQGRHWYDTGNRTVKVWIGSTWQVKNRVFLCKLDSGVIPTSLTQNADFTGSQVDDSTVIFAGQVVFDNSNNPLKGTDGKFITTEDKLRTQTAMGAGVKLSALISEAEAAENLPAYSIVTYVDFGRINRANATTGTETGQYGIIESSAAKGETVNVVTSGIVSNASWDWTSVGINQPLYCTSTGLLSTSPVAPNQIPIATIVGKQTIQLGTPRVSVSPTVTNTTTVAAPTMTDVVPGVAKLNMPAAVPSAPVVVGANDPRLSDARPSLPHDHTQDEVAGLSAVLSGLLPLTGGSMSGTLVLAGQPSGPLDATTKQYVDERTVPGIPTTGGSMTGLLLLSGDPVLGAGAATKQYVDRRVLRTGDTMSGPLTLNADPTTALHAATKQYVDTRVLKSGDTMTGFLILNADPTSQLGAVPKRYVDNLVAATLQRAGGSMTGALMLASNPTVALQAATKQYVDSAVSSIQSLGVASVNLKTGTVVLTASDITIADNGNRITASDVEGALQELALSTTTLNTLVSGAVSAAANLGIGTGVFSAKSGNTLQFKSVVAGSNVTVTSDSTTVTISAAASGETNTASNLGTGNGVYASKSGADLQFKSVVAGSGITVTPTSTDLTIATTAEANTASNLGAGTAIFAAKSGVDLRFKTLVAGTNITITNTANDVTISAAGGATGETNTASNLGTGIGLYQQKSGADLQFNSLVAGTGVTISAPSGGNITIATTGEANTGTNLGTGNGIYTTKSGTALQFKSLVAGANITLTPTTNDITIAAATPTASGVAITDAGSYYATKNVEFALQYLGARNVQCLPIACSDETTALAVTPGVVTFRMPYAMTLTAVRASLTTAQTSGALLTVNIKQSGTTILSTLITLDNTEKTTTTAATPAVISTASLTDDAEMTIDITQVGDGTAKGLKVYLIGKIT